MSTRGLTSRLVIGALAGLTATTVMTAVMRRLHEKLPGEERYPLPPREITERIAPEEMEDEVLRDVSLLAHYGYGAATGALMAISGTQNRQATGAAIGTGIWALSYFGWVPGLGILKPASRHPVRRNALMICAHLVWGAVTHCSIREISAARETMLANGPLRDAPQPPAPRPPINKGDLT